LKTNTNKQKDQEKKNFEAMQRDNEALIEAHKRNIEKKKSPPGN